jgi:hypothetical protein
LSSIVYDQNFLDTPGYSKAMKENIDYLVTTERRLPSSSHWHTRKETTNGKIGGTKEKTRRRKWNHMQTSRTRLRLKHGLKNEERAGTQQWH